MSVFFQPIHHLGRRRVDRPERRPKGLRVVEVDEVCPLMGDDVIHDVYRGEHESDVDRDVAL